MLDLENIFGDPDGRPLATGSMPEGPANGMALVVGTKPTVPTLRLLDPTTPADSPFAGWVRRPDIAGRMGWEAPDLPEWLRWWARCDFEDLPEPPEGFRFGETQETVPQNRPSCVSQVGDDTKCLFGM